jgi:hypothetical protein
MSTILNLNARTEKRLFHFETGTALYVPITFLLSTRKTCPFLSILRANQQHAENEQAVTQDSPEGFLRTGDLPEDADWPQIGNSTNWFATVSNEGLEAFNCVDQLFD